MRGTLIQVVNPKEGISREGYEALCRTHGTEPEYENVTTAPADPPEPEQDSSPDDR